MQLQGKCNTKRLQFHTQTSCIKNDWISYNLHLSSEFQISDLFLSSLPLFRMRARAGVSPEFYQVYIFGNYSLAPLPCGPGFKSNPLQYVGCKGLKTPT